MKDLTYKVCIFGDGGVGKTTLVSRYLTGIFQPETKITIGVNFHMKNLLVHNKSISLQIWDFAGEERFRELMPGYLRGASGGIFMYDISRYASLESITQWLETLKMTNSDDIHLLMVGGKLDLADERNFTLQEAGEYAEKNKFEGLIECSSKTGENVENVFTKIAELIIDKGE